MGGRRAKLRPSAIGTRVGTSNTKQATLRGLGQMKGWTPYYKDMTEIARGTTLSQRQRDVVNTRGFQIDMYFRTRTRAEALPSEVYFLNVAVVAPEDRWDDTPDFVDDFFRARNNNDERAVDLGGGLGSIDLHRLPINTDDMVVLKHKRYMMNTFASGHKGWVKRIKWYVPLKRQIAYDGLTATDSVNPVYIVWWCCRGFQPSGTGSDLTTDFLDYQYRTITYFRETPN